MAVIARYHPTDGADANPCSRCGLRTALLPLTTCLRCYRAVRGITQADVARQLHIPVNTLARWERGALRIERPAILALALAHLAEQ